ncbi:DUF3850 domain-containing protein [Patescibacteria group bacterium]|nr:DUF3850 domain-containing protein [Patescibacteria group bacterium]
MIIEKKILPGYFDDISSGKKKYELRLADWPCREGDILYLREWDPATRQYTGREVKKKITYVKVFKTDQLFWPKADVDKYGLQVMSLE